MHIPSIPHKILLLLAPLLCTVPAAWAQTEPAPAVCDRTPQVRAWITGQVLGVTDCAAVTAEQLAAISADIDLSGDEITTLQAGDFQGLGLIDTLDLSFNSLRTLPVGVFRGLSLSGSLNLSLSGLETLPVEVFDGLSVGDTLNLSLNSLETLPAGVFSGLSLSGSLTLSDNSLKTLPVGVFRGLSLSGSLDLSLNDLEALPVGVFDGLSVDDTLNLFANALETLPAEVFSGLSLSGSLSLAGNSLETLPAEVFRGLSLSGSLGISSNSLTMLPAGIFEGLSLSGSLTLAGNRLTILPAGIFEGLSLTEPLSRLYLQNNLGSPFLLTVELERIGAVPSAVSPAEMRLRLVEGTPFAITVPLTISSGATEFSSMATIAAGATASETFTVTRSGSGVTIVKLGTLPALPDNYQGLRLLGSPPLVLFGAVDDTAPTVTNAELTSTPTRNQTYTTAEMIEVTLTFSEPVIIDTTTSRPGFSLQVGTAVREAAYSSGGRSSTALVFRYWAVGGDEDSDGLGWAAEALHLNGATLADRAGNAASLVVPAQAAATGHKVFALQVSLPRAHTNAAEGEVVRIEVSAAPPPVTDLTLSYSIDSDFDVDTVDIRGGDYRDDNGGVIMMPAGETTAYIEFTIVNDDLAEPAEVFAVSLLGARTADGESVSRGVSFSYGTIAPDPDDAIMVSVTGPAFVREGATASYTVALTGGTPTTTVVVPWTIAGTAAAGVDYNTTPSGLLIIFVGQSTGRITIQTVDDNSGDAGETLVVTLGTPTGGGGPPESLTAGTKEVHTTLTEVAAVVDVALLSVPRSIRSITPNTYGASEQIIVRVRFSEAVQPGGSGTPMLALGIGAETVNAALDMPSSVGTDLVFRHTVSATDIDTDGLSVAADALALGSATLTDTGGTAANINLGSHAFNNDNAHKVDGNQTVATMDLSGDGSVDIVDAKLLHYALALQMHSTLGDGSEGSGDAGVRAEVLGSLVRASDAQWRGMLRAAHALTLIPASSPADLNGDNSVDSNDAALFYYAQALPAALMDAQLRRTILGPLYPSADDAALQQVLEAIGQFGETP